MYRFAPSPTGDMHIGNLRAAIINFIMARQSKSGFFLRIEDTDEARNIKGKDAEIMEILTKFGIKWDNLYYQSKNLKFHQELAAKLLMDKKAFLCFCQEDELELKKNLAKENKDAYQYDGKCQNLSDDEVLNNPNPCVIRLKRPENDMSFTDAIKGELKFEKESIDSFVIMRADKTPTYNFACAVDDMLQGVDFVIRGEDHTSNTPKQELIRHYLGYTQNFGYAHLPIILNQDGKKMSKRDKSSSVKWLLEEGYMPEAILNYLILLGNKTPCEIFTLDEAIEWFSLENLSKSPAKFDQDKLSQINREHIKRASDERLSEIFGFNRANLVKFYTQESSLIPEIKEKIEKIYSKKSFTNFQNEAKILKNLIINMEIPDTYDEFKSNLAASNLKGKSFFMPLRLLLTGNEHGPDLKELYELIKNDLKEIVIL